MKRDIIEGTCTCLGRASRSSYQRCWKLRDLRDSHHHHHQIIASLHFTTQLQRQHTSTADALRRPTRCHSTCDRVVLHAIASQRLELLTFRPSLMSCLKDLVPRNPVRPATIIRTAKLHNRLQCRHRGRARPSSPLRQTSTLKHWSKATRTFPTWIEYHAI